MGKLDSTITLTGSVGNLSFYKTQDGYIVRRKYGPSARRIKTDPAYARTRENNAEFARAGKATRLMRLAFARLLRSMADNRVSGRLTREFLKVIKSDTRNPHGERNVADGDNSLLEGFEFNVHGSLSKSFRAPFTTSVDSGNFSGAFDSLSHRSGPEPSVPELAAGIDVAEFNPSKSVFAPEGATHFQLSSAAAVINFAENSWQATSADSGPLPLEPTVLPALHLQHKLKSTGPGPGFLLLGIGFLQAVNGAFLPLQNTTHNALAVVRAFYAPS